MFLPLDLQGNRNLCISGGMLSHSRHYCSLSPLAKGQKLDLARFRVRKTGRKKLPLQGLYLVHYTLFHTVKLFCEILGNESLPFFAFVFVFVFFNLQQGIEILPLALPCDFSYRNYESSSYLFALPSFSFLQSKNRVLTFCLTM